MHSSSPSSSLCSSTLTNRPFNLCLHTTHDEALTTCPDGPFSCQIVQTVRGLAPGISFFGPCCAPKGSPQDQLLSFLHGSPSEYEGQDLLSFLSSSPTLLAPLAVLPAPPPLTVSQHHRREKGAVTAPVGTFYFSPHLPVDPLKNPTKHARVSLGERRLLRALNPSPAPLPPCPLLPPPIPSPCPLLPLCATVAA